MKIFQSLKAIKIFLILIGILSFTESAYLQTINLIETFNNTYYNDYNFFVKVSWDRYTNYIKIEVESFYNEIAISYYQNDFKFKERKQLSHTFSKSTFMWLNKNQFKNNFYFSINCKTSYCEYNLKIYKKEYAELNIGDIYTYYVTEENKNMIFLINLNYKKYNDSITDKSKIAIWARGSNNNISSKLEPNSFTNLINDNYQAYLLHINEIDINKHYYLKVEGNIGDLINVGSLPFDEYNTCPIIFKDLGTEITGFFKENIFEKNCFKFIGANNNSFNQFIYDFEIKNSIDNYEFKYFKNYTIMCLNFNKSNNYDEYLYSLQYVRNDLKQRLDYFVSPLIIGKNYKISLNEGETIGLIPTQLDMDFNFITYHAYDLFGTCKYTIYECSNYPFCFNNINLKQKHKRLTYYDGSFSISYNKNEYNNTPTSLSQKVLLIESISSDNLINVNFYSNKNKIFIFPQITFYNYLRKNNEDNLLINLPYNNGTIPDSPYAYLSLEILSGNSNINFETPKSSNLKTIQNNNKKSFIFRYIHKNENLLKIKANENTVYRIFYVFEENTNSFFMGHYRLPLGNNFLLDMKKKYKEYILDFNNKINYINISYLEFHPINCTFNVEDNQWAYYNRKNLSEYKDFFYYSNYLGHKFSFRIKRTDYYYEKSCLFYVCTSIFDNNLRERFLILPNNILQYFDLDSNSRINYLYYHSDIDNDLLINFEMDLYSYSYQKYLAYYVEVYINNIYCRKIYLYHNDFFIILSSQVKNYCTDENQFCLIKFAVFSRYYMRKEIALKVTIEKKIKIQSNFWKDNLILIILGSIALFVIIIIIIVCLCKKNRNKGDLLALEVNKVSFEEERINNNKVYQDGLLY